LIHGQNYSRKIYGKGFDKSISLFKWENISGFAQKAHFQAVIPQGMSVTFLSRGGVQIKDIQSFSHYGQSLMIPKAQAQAQYGELKRSEPLLTL
jgi:hypothetical protein